MTRQDAFFRLLTAAGFVAFMSCTTLSFAGAQDVPAPDDSQLKTPGQAAAAAEPTLAPDTQAQAAPAQQQAGQQQTMPDQPDAVRNTGPVANDPCPAPDTAIDKAPDDLAKVQEDIDRFTLCVQRAQLLERLNESILRNQDAGDTALGLKAPGIAGAQRAGGPGLLPLPANALAGADVSPLAAEGAPMKPRASDTAPAATKETETPAQSADAVAEAAKPWTIREIYSAGGGVEAKLISPEGDEFKAKNGQKLPDGKTTVVRITPAGVTVKDDKGMKPLDWTKI